MNTKSSGTATYQVQIFNHLRAISIVFIILYHFALEVSNFQIRPQIGNFSQNLQLLQIFPNQFFPNLLVSLFSIGWQFVGVFLFLSGFGLTYSKLSKNHSKSFVDRIFKLIPTWHIAIATAFLFNFTGYKLYPQHINQASNIAPSHYFFLLLFPLTIDFSFAHIPFVNPTLWFVILIIQFYLLFELLFKFLIKFGPYKFLLISLIITFAYRAVLIYFLHQQPSTLASIENRSGNLMVFLLARLFECSLGMFWAYFLHNKIDLINFIKTKIIVLGLATFILGNIATWSKVGWIFSDTLLTIGLVIVSLSLLKSYSNSILNSTLLKISHASFLLYLFHNQIVTQILTPQLIILGQITEQPGIIFTLFSAIILFLIVIFSNVYNRFSSD